MEMKTMSISIVALYQSNNRHNDCSFLLFHGNGNISSFYFLCFLLILVVCFYLCVLVALHLLDVVFSNNIVTFLCCIVFVFASCVTIILFIFF
jgi:hypothetical protein